MNRFLKLSCSLTLLILAAPGCTIIEKDLLDEPSTATTASDSDSGTDVTVTGSGTGTGTDAPATTINDTAVDTDDTADTADTADTLDTEGPPAECAIDTKDKSEYFSTSAVEIDEVCNVAIVTMVGNAFKIGFDCPLHAEMFPGAPVEMLIESGPQPGVFWEVGSPVAVYFQPGDFNGFMDLANPEMLFVSTVQGELIYASIRGYFIRDEDFARVVEKAKPLAVTLIAGPCAHFPTGWDGVGDGTACVDEAVSQIQLTGGDVPVVLGEGETATIQVGASSYDVDVRMARHGQDCVDMDELVRYTVAIAQQQ